MRCLLDSHVLYQSVFEQGKLAPKYRRVIELPNANLYISVVSLWELAIKQSVGKLDMPDDFHLRLEETALTLLPLTTLHIQQIRHLPFHHRDPFDRMLIAQAKAEGLTFLSDDHDVQHYGKIVSLL